MDDDTIPLGRDFLGDFYKPPLPQSHEVKKCGTQRQTARHTASHVDFRVNPDTERIRDRENSRRKHRAKCCHCEFSYCPDSQENYSIDANRKNDHFSRKNSEKSEAMLSQHLEYGKSGNFTINSRRPSASSQQRGQTHRPGTSTIRCHNRTNQSNTVVHRNSQKLDNFCSRQRPRCDSTLRETVYSDGEKEETDYCLSHDQTRSRNMCKRTEPFWRSGEPHSEPETDVSPKNHRQECSDLRNRNSGEGESLEVSHFEGDCKPSIETGSSVVRDDWQQYERDQRELKELGEDLRQFVKHKMSSGQVEDEKKEEDDRSTDTLDKINRFVSKLSEPKQKNSKTKLSSDARKNCAPSSKRRVRTSRIVPRKTYNSSKIEERRSGEEDKDRELGRKLVDELLDIQLESSKLDEEEETETYEEGDEDEVKRGKEEIEAASETEEEARQLLKEESDTEHIKRRLKKSWTEWIQDGSGNSRDMRKFERVERDDDSRDKQKREHILRATRNEKKFEKLKNSYKIMEIPVTNVDKRNYSDTTVTRAHDSRHCTEPWEKFNSRKNKSCRDDKAETDDTREKFYENPHSMLNVTRNNCNELPPDYGGKRDIELDANTTKASIDEMIDDGLSREAKRVNTAALPLMKEEIPNEEEEEEEDERSRVYLKNRRNSNELTKVMRGEDSCHTMTRRREIFPITPRINVDSSRRKREECFCRRIGKILADNPSPEYVRKLKNRRWYYLESIRNVLAKLYDLEGFLDMCSPERETSIFKTEMNSDLTG